MPKNDRLARNGFFSVEFCCRIRVYFRAQFEITDSFSHIIYSQFKSDRYHANSRYTGVPAIMLLRLAIASKP